jgi:hypothetical protein
MASLAPDVVVVRASRRICRLDPGVRLGVEHDDGCIGDSSVMDRRYSNVHTNAMASSSEAGCSNSTSVLGDYPTWQ